MFPSFHFGRIAYPIGLGKFFKVGLFFLGYFFPSRRYFLGQIGKNGFVSMDSIAGKIRKNVFAVV